MGLEDKRVSKIYRKIVTSNEIKAYGIYERLDEDMKEAVIGKLTQNGSHKANEMLEKLKVM